MTAERLHISQTNMNVSIFKEGSIALGIYVNKCYLHFKDPDKYLAVLPYKDVYELFNMLNKFIRPQNIPSNVHHLMKSSTKM